MRGGRQEAAGKRRRHPNYNFVNRLDLKNLYLIAVSYQFPIPSAFKCDDVASRYVTSFMLFIFCNKVKGQKHETETV